MTVCPTRRRGRAAAPTRRRHPTACPGDPRPPRPAGRRSDAGVASRRNRVPSSSVVAHGCSPRVESATTLRTGARVPLAVDLPDREHPVAIRRRTRDHRGCASRPPAGRRRQGLSAWLPPRPRGSGTVAPPHPPVRLVDVGEGSGRPSRHEAQGAPAVLVDPAPDAHPVRRVVGQVPGLAAHHDHAARLGRAGLQPVERVAVRAELREGDLGPGRRHPPRSDEAQPPYPAIVVTAPNVPVAAVRARRRRRRPSTVSLCASRPTCSRRPGRSSDRAVVELADTDLPAGEVLIRVEWSAINFKDAMVTRPGNRVA